MKNQRIPPYQKTKLDKISAIKNRQPKKVLRPKQVFKGPGTKNRNEKKAYNNSKKKKSKLQYSVAENVGADKEKKC